MLHTENRNVRYSIVTMQPATHAEPTPRQQAVLDAALALLVEEGDQLTMTAVARRASCSKETLYKWFGDRDGLLTATVQWQASKVTGRAGRPRAARRSPRCARASSSSPRTG